MRICELKQREAINVKDCKRLGFVGDVDFDISTGKMLAIIVPGPGCVWGFLGREKEYIIPFCDICQIGDDIILVRLKEEREKKEERRNSGKLLLAEAHFLRYYNKYDML